MRVFCVQKAEESPTSEPCFRIRPYIETSTPSRPIREVKPQLALLVVRWVTTGEHGGVVSIFFSSVFLIVLLFLFFFFSSAHTQKHPEPNFPHDACDVVERVGTSCCCSVVFDTFSAFWLRSSVVSVLISIIPDTCPKWALVNYPHF